MRVARAGLLCAGSLTQVERLDEALIVYDEIVLTDAGAAVPPAAALHALKPSCSRMRALVVRAAAIAAVARRSAFQPCLCGSVWQGEITRAR